MIAPAAELLDVLASGPIAWFTPADLAERLGRSLDETHDLLTSLDLDGRLMVREDDDAVRVGLSPLGLARDFPAEAGGPKARLARALTSRAFHELRHPEACHSVGAKRGRDQDRLRVACPSA